MLCRPPKPRVMRTTTHADSCFRMPTDASSWLTPSCGCENRHCNLCLAYMTSHLRTACYRNWLPRWCTVQTFVVSPACVGCTWRRAPCFRPEASIYGSPGVKVLVGTKALRVGGQQPDRAGGSGLSGVEYGAPGYGLDTGINPYRYACVCTSAAALRVRMCSTSWSVHNYCCGSVASA